MCVKKFYTTRNKILAESNKKMKNFPIDPHYNKSCQKTTKLAGRKGSEVKVKVTGVKNVDIHGKDLSQGICVQNIKGIPQLVWEL